MVIDDVMYMIKSVDSDGNSDNRFYFKKYKGRIRVYIDKGDGYPSLLATGTVSRKSMLSRWYKLYIGKQGGGMDLDLLSMTATIDIYGKNGTETMAYGKYVDAKAYACWKSITRSFRERECLR